MRLAEAAGVSIEWLATGRNIGSTAIEGQDFVGVPRFNAELSAGHGSFVERADHLDDIPFTQAFLARKLGRSQADGLIIVEARGDSMAPRIEDGDLVMIDTHDTRLRDGLTAFVWADQAHIKRLRVGPRSIEVLSENPAYPPFEINAADIEQGLLMVIGRVKWYGHVEER